MEEVAWARAVEQARAGEAVCDVEALTLDGLVKCAQGKLPNSKIFALFTQLKRLSIASVGLSSLADFPSLPHLERLILSDNRIGGGLEYLVYAGLKSLRELDLSNNKIHAVEDLKPLAQLKLESLDLYECPVTRSADYRAKVFGMMKSLRFLDKTDVIGNERPESDEEEEEEEEEDVDDLNGDGVELEGEEGQEDDLQGAVVPEDDEGGEDDEDRDDDDYKEFEDEEEEAGSYQEEVLAAASGRRVVQGHMNNEHGSDDEEVEDDEDDNVEVQDIEDSEEEEVADEDDEDAVVDEEEEDIEEPVNGAHVGTGGELDVQENEDEEDDNGEVGEGEQDDVGDDAVDNGEGEEEVEEEDDEEEEECGTNYLVQPIGQPEEDEGASDFEPEDGDNEDFEDFEDEDFVGLLQNRKRIREETGEKEDRLAKRV